MIGTLAKLGFIADNKAEKKNLAYPTSIEGQPVTSKGPTVMAFTNRITKLLFREEKGQKAILTFIAFFTLSSMTWILLNYPNLHPVIKTNASALVYIASLYFFFQVYDNLFSWVTKLLFSQPLGTSFAAEFSKFFLTLMSSSLYNHEFIMRPLLRIKQNPNLVYLAFSSAIFATVCAVIFHRFRQMKEIALKSRLAQAEAQYSLLESQMQPHFLFNSLNVLSELIYVDPDQANSMSQKLADLYREILNNSKNKFSTLESEISILEKYIEIQKIRFGDRIRFHTDVSPAFLNLQIPSLILQTLVENAIKHGISPKKEGGEIELSVKKMGPLFRVQISNTGELYKGHESSKRSTGLQNTRNRLTLMYSNKHQFKIYSDKTKTYVQFRITGRSS